MEAERSVFLTLSVAEGRKVGCQKEITRADRKNLVTTFRSTVSHSSNRQPNCRRSQSSENATPWLSVVLLGYSNRS